jgi:hypothetical protein
MAKSNTNQKDDTDSEGEKPVKKVTKKAVVTKNQKDDTDSECEKPVKKVTKKGTVTKNKKMIQIVKMKSLLKK